MVFQQDVCPCASLSCRRRQERILMVEREVSQVGVTLGGSGGHDGVGVDMGDVIVDDGGDVEVVAVIPGDVMVDVGDDDDDVEVIAVIPGDVMVDVGDDDDDVEVIAVIPGVVTRAFYLGRGTVDDAIVVG